MTINIEQFSELNDLYCELTSRIQNVMIPVKDVDTSIVSTRHYIFILDPGTVVRFNGHIYFYSCPFKMMNLEGTWTDEESNAYSVHEFLCKILDEETIVEVILE